jgi:hypothetical protein
MDSTLKNLIVGAALRGWLSYRAAAALIALFNLRGA